MASLPRPGIYCTTRWGAGVATAGTPLADAEGEEEGRGGGMRRGERGRGESEGSGRV